MLKEHQITPIIVFDGAPIPIKKRIQEIRAKIRLKSREKVTRLLKEGDYEANKKFGESFTITPYVVQKLFKIVSKKGYQCIISPYEADAQLAYLFKSGQVEVVFTEDSDLIAYGVTKLLYKLDNNSKGIEIDMEGLFHEDDSDKIRAETSEEVSKLEDPIEINLVEEDSGDHNSLCILHSQKGSQSSSDNSSPEKIPIFSRENFLMICILAG